MKFTKMHGLGNDFVVIDGINQAVDLSPEQLRFIANRRLGVGCDQVLLVEQPQTPDADFRYRIFNADGNEVEQCGNGARAFARFVRDEGLADKAHTRVETAAGLIELTLEADDQVTVDMGTPKLMPDEIPLKMDARATNYRLEVEDEVIEFGAVSMGNPHMVLRVDNVQTAPVTELGPRLEADAHFPARVNVGFMEVVDRERIRLRVYERGVGETLACGTGACAAVVAGQIQGLLDRRVAVDLPGGRLMISWQGEGTPVIMTGPATRVFEGTINI